MIIFEVDGVPIGQGVLRRNRFGSMYEATRGHGAWRSAVIAAVQAEYDDAQMMTGPLGVTVLFTFPRPKAHRTSTGKPSAQWRTYHRSKPDLDHLIRSIGDALTIGGIIKDDSQIAHWDALKMYGDVPCARVVIRQMDEGERS